MPQRPARELLVPVFRRQPARGLEELRGGPLRAPLRGLPRGLFQLVGDRLVGLRRAQGEMARPLFGVGDDGCEPFVELAAPLRRRGPVDR